MGKRKSLPEEPGEGGKKVNGSHCYPSAHSNSFPCEDGKLLEVDARLSVAEALRPEGAPPWLATMQRDETNLEAACTWREPIEEKLVAKKKVVPADIHLATKIDGSFKSRAFFLGDLVNAGGGSVYAPAFTMAGQGYFLTPPVAQGHHTKSPDTGSDLSKYR